MSQDSNSPAYPPTQDTSRNPDPRATDRDVPSAPQHRLHDSSQPLPRPQGENYERTPEDMGAGQQQQRGERSCEHHHGAQRTAHGGGIGPERYDDGGYQGAGTGRNAYTTERPLGVTPVPEGGVAIGGQPNLQASQASMTDRIVGKTEKVVGKVTNNPHMHERGELREAGGTAAAEGRARAPHD